MSSRRLLVSATTNDAWAAEEMRVVDEPSWLNAWASCVTLTDTVGLSLGKTEIRAPSICNIHAAALSLINVSDDQIVFNELIGPGAGDLRVPVTVNTSAIIEISAVPVVG